MIRWSNRVFFSVFLAVTAVAANGCTKQDPTARVGKVTRGDLLQQITMAGTVIPKRRTVILPPYNGYVKKMYVHVGELVKAGMPVVSVVQNLGTNEEVYPLRSPFDGMVVQVLHYDGEYVDMSNADSNVLVRIDDLSRLMVLADVSEMDLPKLKVGQEVVVRAAAILTRSYKGVIREMFDAAREKKGWDRSSDKVDFPIRIEILDQDATIKPGMSALVDVIANKHEGVLKLGLEFIDKDASPVGSAKSKDAELASYSVTLTDGTKRAVKVGLQNDEAFEILDGLKEGDRVRQVDFLAGANAE